MHKRIVLIAVISSLTLARATAKISSTAKIEIAEHLQLISDLD